MPQPQLSESTALELLALVGSRPHMLDINQAITGTYTARKPYRVVDGIAIIDVCGLLINDETWGDGWYCSSYTRIQSEILGALESTEVEGILLLIDSPGGETDNAFETAALLAEAATLKPLWAVAAVSAYSAAYLLASQAAAIFAPETSGGMGSIGVYWVHLDWSKALDKMGIKPTILQAGEGKTDGNPYEPLSDAARESIQGEVDRLYGEFVEAVAVGRGISADKIRNQIGAHTISGGGALIEAGLADAIGSVETVMQEFRAELTAAKKRASSQAFAAAATANTTKGGMGNSMPNLLKKPVGASAGEDDKTKSTSTENADPKPEPTEEQPKAAAAPAATSDQIAEARKQGYAEALEIVSLCSIAKKPAEALGFLKKGATPAAVREQLTEAMAAESDKDPIHSQVAPGTGAKDATAEGSKDGSALLAGMAQINKQQHSTKGAN